IWSRRLCMRVAELHMHVSQVRKPNVGDRALSREPTRIVRSRNTSWCAARHYFSKKASIGERSGLCSSRMMKRFSRSGPQSQGENKMVSDWSAKKSLLRITHEWRWLFLEMLKLLLYGRVPASLSTKTRE